MSYRCYLKKSLLLGLILAMIVPTWAADPIVNQVAEVRISAKETDYVEQVLDLCVYQRDGNQVFQMVDELEFTTPINRVTQDVSFHVTPNTQNVSVMVDYLTDLDQDGRYELVSGKENPAGDALTPAGSLTAANSGVSSSLSMGQEYILNAEALLIRGQAALFDRTTQGSTTYLPNLSPAPQASSSADMIYMVTVRYTAPESQQEHEQCYYLRLYEDQLPPPSAADYLDVPSSVWYYEGVDYVVSHGILSGTALSRFQPEQPLTRASLAHALYTLSEKPETAHIQFADVPMDFWAYPAVSWVVSENLMSGITHTTFAPNQPVTRGELAFALYRYAKSQHVDTDPSADLSSYSDAQQVAPWAQEGVQWAVSQGLLTGRGSTQPKLEPNTAVTRGEFSAMIQLFCENILPSANPSPKFLFW